MIGFVLIPMGYAQEPPPAQLTVSKAITYIVPEGGNPIEDPSEIAAFLADVPNYTVITFEAVLTVENTGGVLVEDFVVTDHFGAELDVMCVSEIDPICVVNPKGKAADRLTWDVESLDPAQSASLIVSATTNLDPSDYQRYTSCGLHYFNSGPTAKDKVAKLNGKGLRQISDDGDPIELTVSGIFLVQLPQCSNCIDDDGDGLVDLDDPDCVDALDDNELE